MIKVFVTGHRPDKLPGGYNLSSEGSLAIYRALYSALERLLDADSIEVISGMALGVDTIFYYAGLNLRKQYGDRVRVHSVIPHEDQAGRWPQSSQERWAYLRTQADVETICHEGDYKTWMLLDRNQRMVNMADLGIAVWNGELKGGTYNAVTKAKKAELTMLHIDVNGNIIGYI